MGIEVGRKEPGQPHSFLSLASKEVDTQCEPEPLPVPLGVPLRHPRCLRFFFSGLQTLLRPLPAGPEIDALVGGQLALCQSSVW